MLNRLSPRAFAWLVGGIVAGGLLVSAAILFWPSRTPRNVGGVTLPSYPTAVVSEGRTLYATTCAECHGPSGAGNADLEIPALNGSMHAWHHPDSQIAGMLRSGQGAMPAVGAGWSDAHIEAVLAYIKQWWEPEQLAWQTRASEQNP